MISVSDLQPSDREAWETLFSGYNAFYGRTWPAEKYDWAWQRFQAGTDVHALGARFDGHLVGITHFLTHASTTAGDVCYLQDLFTSPEVRGKGVGRALIEAVADWSRARGCERVYWHTKEDNQTARRLYDAVSANDGFIKYTITL